MTKTTAEMIAVMQAYERGEKIECRNIKQEEWYPLANFWCDRLWNWETADFRIAPPKPVQHQIDWSHVGDKFCAIVTTSKGEVYLTTSLPKLSLDTFEWPMTTTFLDADVFSSFKPGNMPWQESLVIRPKGV